MCISMAVCRWQSITICLPLASSPCVRQNFLALGFHGLSNRTATAVDCSTACLLGANPVASTSLVKLQHLLSPVRSCNAMCQSSHPLLAYMSVTPRTRHRSLWQRPVSSAHHCSALGSRTPLFPHAGTSVYPQKHSSSLYGTLRVPFLPHPMLWLLP